MSEIKIGRRDWLKLGGLGGAAALLGGCAKVSATGGKGDVRGIVFLVSDGMSNGVLTMAENFSQIVRGKGTRWWELIGDPACTCGLQECSSADSFVTDSSAAASAWGGGVKINNGAVNIRPDGSESTPILRHLKKLGGRTGLVTTATVTHATPAGFAAVTASRNDEHLIAPQYLGAVDLIMGGGRNFFTAEKRVDSRDIVTPYTKAGYELIEDRDALLKSKSDKVLGLFSGSHLPFEVDRLNDPELIRKIPTLAEMSEAALKNLMGHPEKFLLQIEGARIDHAAHVNDIAGLLWDQLAFDDTIARVLEMTAGREDILVIVTSDHGNANPGLNGTGKNYAQTNKAFASITRMTASYEKLFEKWGRSTENTPERLAAIIKEKLGFSLTDKQSAELFSSITTGVVSEWSEQLDNPHGLLGQFAGNHTGIGWTGTSHTSDPTMISAIGPQSERFTGIVPNHEMHRHFMELLS
jgi:alkaline phosphatase